jgi:hypothetical protein
MNETLQEWYELEPRARGVIPRADIAPHRLGEPFTEWLRLNALDLDSICQKHKRDDKTIDFKSVCKTLSTIRDSIFIAPVQPRHCCNLLSALK